MRELLRQGHDINFNIKDNEGDTAFEVAIDESRQEGFSSMAKMMVYHCNNA